MEVQIRCTGSGMMPLNQIIPLQGGLKDLSDANYRKLKNQILTHGMVSPFMIWEGRCIDGHQRLRTLLKMKEEGILMPESFPKVDIEAPDIKSAKRILLAISSQYGKLTGDGLYEYMQDMEIDIPEMKESFEFDSLDFGDFEKEYFTDIISSPTEDNIPEDAPTISKLGDIWHLGNHRIMCNDSTKEEKIKDLIGKEKMDMIFTDPPYGVHLDTNYQDIYTNSTTGKNHATVIGDDADFDPSFIFDFFPTIPEMFLWGADYYLKKIQGFENGSLIVWDKTQGDFKGRIGNEFEMCWSKKKHQKVIHHLLWAGYNGLEKEDTKKRMHPTQKPVKLCEDIISKYSDSEDFVLDMFLGSGTTLIACEKTNRRCLGLEIDPHYIDVIVKRYSDFTHQSDNIYLERDGEKIPYSTLVDLNPIL